VIHIEASTERSGMSLLAEPPVTALAAKAIQRLITIMDATGGPGSAASLQPLCRSSATHARADGADNGRPGAGGGVPPTTATHSTDSAAPPVHVNFHGGGSIALQVLHYPPLDLTTNARDNAPSSPSRC
jgi:acetyl esterase